MNGRALVFTAFFGLLASPAAFAGAPGFAPPSGESALGVATYGATSFVGKLDAAGHSAAYFPTLCPDESPFKLRRCRAGELGSFLNRYGMMGTSETGEPFQKDWAVTPALSHLYGVEKIEDVPLIVTDDVSAVLKESNRQKYLSQWIRGPKPGERLSPGEWESNYAVMSVRGVDIILVDIDEKETQSLMDFLNQSPNQASFNVLWANCADQSKAVFNQLFPGSVHRSIKDFNMTSPTAVAHGADKFGQKNAERRLRYLTIQQLPGTFSYDGPVRYAMDDAWKEPKFLLPLLHAPHYLVPFFVISMFDRYNKDKQRVKYPSLEVADLREELDQESRSKDAGQDERVTALKKQIEVTVTALDAQEDAPYEHYRQVFTWLVSAAAEKGLLAAEQDRLLRGERPQKYLEGFQGAGNSVRLDSARGLLLTQVSPQGGERTAGLSAGNIASEDPRLGFQVIVGAVNYMLKVDKKDRPALVDLQRNWKIMRELGSKLGLEIPESLTARLAS